MSSIREALTLADQIIALFQSLSNENSESKDSGEEGSDKPENSAEEQERDSQEPEAQDQEDVEIRVVYVGNLPDCSVLYINTVSLVLSEPCHNPS